MPVTLAERVAQIKPSATMAVNTRASELRAQGQDILNLSVGEPDFDTPAFVKIAAIAAINEGFTKYTPVEGIVELRDTICKKLERDNQLQYNSKEIIVSDGVKQVIYNLAQATLNTGDEAIIPAPYWVSYPAIVELAGAKPIIINTQAKNRYKIT